MARHGEIAKGQRAAVNHVSSVRRRDEVHARGGRRSGVGGSSQLRKAVLALIQAWFQQHGVA